MSIFFVTFGVLLLVFALMAVGLVFRNKPIQGTCASLSTIGFDKGSCEICGGDPARCDSGDTTQAPVPGQATLYAPARRMDKP